MLCTAVIILLGCGKPNTGVFSASDYSYLTDTPEQLSSVRNRFESAVKYAESAGLESDSVNRSEEGIEAIFSGKGIDARLTLTPHDNGFTTITLTYSYAGTGTETKIEAESLLTSLQNILDPAVPSPKERTGNSDD